MKFITPNYTFLCGFTQPFSVGFIRLFNCHINYINNYFYLLSSIQEKPHRTDLSIQWELPYLLLKPFSLYRPNHKQLNLCHLHNTTNYILLFINRSLFSDHLFYYFALYPSFDLERVPSIYLFPHFSKHSYASAANAITFLTSGSFISKYIA